MKKPSSEEKPGLKTGLKEISLLLWFISFSTYFPQVPVNGFCEIQSFPAFPDFEHLIVADINYDSFYDVILYASEQNFIVLIEGNEQGGFNEYKLINVSQHFSNVKTIFDYETGAERFIYTSRKSRTAGIFNFSTFGRFDLVSKLVFDSYPGNIDIADIDNNGTEEYLISGSGFKGLSVLSFDDDKLKEIKVTENFSYGDAVFIDLSNDNYPDVAANNLFNNTLDFFYNDTKNNFTQVRSVPISSDFTGLKSFDINKDDFDDLICTNNNSIKIFYGDFNSAYDSTLSLNTIFQPDKILIADFNGDDLNDIAYIDTSEGILSVCFGKTLNDFYPEVFYSRQEGLSDFGIFDTAEGRGLILLSREGKLFLITRLRMPEDKVSLIPALKPAAIASFDKGNDGTVDLCFIDNYTNTLNLFVNEKLGVPGYYYSIPLSATHQNIVVDDSQPDKKGFYCYSSNGKMLEIVDYNFLTDEFNVKQIYTKGSIEDVGIKSTNDVTEIYVAYKKENRLRVTEYEYHDYRYTHRDYPLIDTDVLTAKLLTSTGLKVYYWKQIKKNLEFVGAEVNSKDITYNSIGKLKQEHKSSELVISELMLNDISPAAVSIINTDTELFTVVSNDSMFNISTLISDNTSFIDKPKLFAVHEPVGENNPAIIYSDGNHSFNKLVLNGNGKKLKTEKLFDVKNITDFIVKKLDDESEFLIYTNQAEGYISYRRLK